MVENMVEVAESSTSTSAGRRSKPRSLAWSFKTSKTTPQVTHFLQKGCTNQLQNVHTSNKVTPYGSIAAIFIQITTDAHSSMHTHNIHSHRDTYIQAYTYRITHTHSIPMYIEYMQTWRDGLVLKSSFCSLSLPPSPHIRKLTTANNSVAKDLIYFSYLWKFVCICMHMYRHRGWGKEERERGAHDHMIFFFCTFLYCSFLGKEKESTREINKFS